MKNLSVFEPQIEKHYAYKKKTCNLDWFSRNRQYLITWYLSGWVRVWVQCANMSYYKGYIIYTINWCDSTHEAFVHLCEFKIYEGFKPKSLSMKYNR